MGSEMCIRDRFYLIHLFDGADALEKPLRKAREGWEYETVVNQIFACWPK